MTLNNDRAGSKTAALGRMLTALGVLWMAWSLVTELVRVDPDITLPFLPGLIIFFVGRALARAGNGGTGDESASGEQPTPVRDASRRPRPAVDEPRPVRRYEREPEPELEPEPLLADLEEAILDPPPPMTSEEMVAEAKRRFAPRPMDEAD